MFDFLAAASRDLEMKKGRDPGALVRQRSQSAQFLGVEGGRVAVVEKR